MSDNISRKIFRLFIGMPQLTQGRPKNEDQLRRDFGLEPCQPQDDVENFAHSLLDQASYSVPIGLLGPGHHLDTAHSSQTICYAGGGE